MITIPKSTGLTPPPIDAMTPETAQLIATTVTGILVFLSLCYTLWMWKRRGTPLYFLILLGGSACMLIEPWLDLISQIWFPSDGWIVFEAYGRPMPLWGLFAYTLFFGTQTFAILELLHKGVSRAKFWLGLIGVWIFNIALEVTVLSADLYFYYGYQPLRIGDFPAVWLVLNCAGVALAAAIFMRFGDFFTGPRVLLAVAVAPVCQLAALWLGIPHFMALNSDVSAVLKTVASAVSIVIGLLVLDAIIRVIARGTPFEEPDESADAALPHAHDEPAKNTAVGLPHARMKGTSNVL
jgi:hypothetical protein